jgi:hypothetical protein
MHAFFIQVQLLLAALSAALPLAPAGNRAQLADVLETIATALKLGESAMDSAESLAARFAAPRGEVERMAAVSPHASPDELEMAFERVRSASAAFRAAYTESATASVSLLGRGVTRCAGGGLVTPPAQRFRSKDARGRVVSAPGFEPGTP